jgi:hypothetical protein
VRRWRAELVSVATLGFILCATPATAQTQTPPPRADPAENAHDSDPTKPVLFSIRPEFSRFDADFSRLTLIFRYDRAQFAKRRWLPGRRGTILRFEVPLARMQVDEAAGEMGLGDAYGQLLLVPYMSRTFALVAGSGLIMPTATGNLLGAGKWVVAPATGPVWFLRGRGMVFLKLQNFVSVAGDARRPDINFLLVTPTLIRTFQRRWWMLADSETRTDWLGDRRTSVKSGLQIGHAISPHVAVWAKPEVWWGGHSNGQWNLKFGVVWYR